MQKQTWLGGKGDLLGIMQETEISPNLTNGIYTNQKLFLKMKCIKSPNSGQKTRLCIDLQQKRTYLVGFAESAVQRMNAKNWINAWT